MDCEDVMSSELVATRRRVGGVLPEGRAILRGGVGRFRQRTPLNVGAFDDSNHEW